MARAGAVFIDVLPSMVGWNAAVRTQAAVSLEGAGLNAGKGFTAGMMRAVKGSPVAQMVGAQAKVAADQAAMAVQSASAKVTAARKREADASGAVRVAETKLAEVRANENASASQIATAEERLAKAQRTQAVAADAASAATAALTRAEEAATTATTALSTESTVATSRFRLMGSSIGSSADHMSSKLGGLAKGAAAMGGLFAGFEAARFAGQSLKAAMEFQRSSNVLVTAAGESVKNLDMIRAGMINVSDTVGTGVDQMNAGMYTIEKAGFRGANGLKILMAAAKGAREENASLATVTNAMTSIMTSYNIRAGDSGKVMNAMATAAGASKTTMEEFAGSLSTVLPIASANHISFAMVAGALGTITAHGTTAYEATQELAFAIRNLAAPNAVAIKEMGQLGISSQQVQMNLGKRGVLGSVMDLSAAILKHMGPSGKVLLDTLHKSTSAGAAQKLMLDQMSPAAKKVADAYASGAMTLGEFRAAVKGSTGVDAGQLTQWKTLFTNAHGFNNAIKQGLPGTQTFSEAMKKMMGGANGLNTALMLLGSNVAPTQRRIAEIGASMGSDKQFNARWKSTSATSAVQVDIAKTTLSNAGMQAMSALLPSIAKDAGALARATVSIMNFAKVNWGWLGPLAKGISAVTAALVAWSIISKITIWVKELTVWQAIAKGSALAWAGAQKVLSAALFVGRWASLIAQVLAYRAAQIAASLATKAWTLTQTVFRVAMSAISWGLQIAGIIAYKTVQIAASVATKAWAAAQWLLNAAMDANPITLAVTAIAALVVGFILAYKHSETFRKIVDTTFHALAAVVGWAVTEIKAHWKLLLAIFLGPFGILLPIIISHWRQIASAASDSFHVIATVFTWLWGNVLKPIFKLWLDTWFTVVGALIHGAADAFGWVPGIGGKLKDAASAFDSFKNSVNTALDGIHSVKDIQFNLLTAGNGHGPAKTVGKLPIYTMGHNAAGTSYWRGGLSVVGENGPEIVSMPRGSQVFNASRTKQMLTGRQGASNSSMDGARFSLVLDDGTPLRGHIERIADARVDSAAQLRGESERAFG